MATLRRFGSNKNSAPRGESSRDDEHIDTITTSASCPWNLSTLPTLANGPSRCFKSRTCMLNGATIRMSSIVIRRGLDLPVSQTRQPTSSLTIDSISHASSSHPCELSSCSTGINTIPACFEISVPFVSIRWSFVLGWLSNRPS